MRMKGFRRVLLGLLLLLPAARGEEEEGKRQVHSATASPSGRYCFASEPVWQREGDAPPMTLGAKVWLLDADKKPLSSCFIPGETYKEMPPEARQDWQTKAFWNSGETRAAIQHGGRTWSGLDFYMVREGHVAQGPQPAWHAVLSRHLPDYAGDTTRFYATFARWVDADTCVVSLSGTADLSAKKGKEAEDAYPQFDFAVTLKFSPQEIRILKVEDEDEEADK